MSDLKHWDDCVCDGNEFIEEGVLYEDGQALDCPDCGYRWCVVCDSETSPYALEVGPPDEPLAPRERSAAPREWFEWAKSYTRSGHSSPSRRDWQGYALHALKVALGLRDQEAT